MENIDAKTDDSAEVIAMPILAPLYDRIVVQRYPEMTHTEGGMEIPDSAKEKPLLGEVIAVGKGRLVGRGDIKKLTVKVGDVILFGRYSGSEIPREALLAVGGIVPDSVRIVVPEGPDLLIMREDEVLSIVGYQRMRRRAQPEPEAVQ